MKIRLYGVINAACFSHALEAYTALPYTERTPRPVDPMYRPVHQGRNPFSDVWAREALQIVNKYFRRLVNSIERSDAHYSLLMMTRA